MKYVAWFSEIDKSNVKEAGGKGANLGEMTRVQFPVPPGFVLLSNAYFDFVEQTNIKHKISVLTRTLDVRDNEKLNKVSEEVKKLIIDTEILPEIKEEIIKAYLELCGSSAPTQEQMVFVAVRSSATAEDLPEASFAGQQASFLNVRSPNDVVDAVKKCWASLFEARAIFYRQEKGFDHLRVGLAAVVQEMVQSERSGVAFTVDPVASDPKKIEIEAAYGLGEVVVSGAVTPDRYVVSKKNFKILEKHIAEQTWMMAKVGDKNEHVNVKEEYRKRQKLDDKYILELAKVCKAIEDHYAYPQDIEWGFVDGKLYIVQSRPVTTLKKIKFEEEGEKEPGQEKQAEQKRERVSVEAAKILVKGLAASPGIGVGKVKQLFSPKEITSMDQGDILVTDMTTPDFVPAMRKASAIVTNAGGSTCHAAIVSRELGIPCIVGTKEATKILKNGMIVTVDAEHGIVYEGEVELEGIVKEELKAAMSGTGQKMSVVAASPTTGTKIYVNLAEAALAEKVALQDVDGVGLLRAEFMIAGIGEHPRKMIEEHRGQEFTDKLSDELRKFCEAFYPRPVVYRTTDFKTNEYRNLEGGAKYEPEEANPMMGYRGCARYVHEPDVFKLELEAIKKVRDVYNLKNLWVMIPFVRRIGEIKAAKEIMNQVGLHRTKDFKLWIMVEVPSTVFLIDEFCELGIDGVSIGTNDLTQLIMGIDRDNPTLAEGFDERNAAVLRAVRHVIKTCRKHKVTTSLCGQAPSVYPDYAEKLVEYGITSISVNPDAIERVRRLVASAEKKIMLNRLAELLEREKEIEQKLG